MPQLYTKEGIVRDERYVRAWINKSDLPDPFTPEDVAQYGFIPYNTPPTPRSELLSTARLRVNLWKSLQEDAGFSAIGHDWDSTPQSREKLLAVVVSGTNPLGFWTNANDVDVPVTLANLQTMYAAMLTRGAQIHARQRELKASLDGMTDEQLAAFTPDWT